VNNHSERHSEDVAEAGTPLCNHGSSFVSPQVSYTLPFFARHGVTWVSLRSTFLPELVATSTSHRLRRLRVCELWSQLVVRSVTYGQLLQGLRQIRCLSDPWFVLWIRSAADSVRRIGLSSGKSYPWHGVAIWDTIVSMSPSNRAISSSSARAWACHSAVRGSAVCLRPSISWTRASIEGSPACAHHSTSSQQSTGWKVLRASTRLARLSFVSAVP
jgi:hypothetical protein